MSWKHDELALDLARHLSTPNRMVWTDMQMGPSGSPRPDVYTMEKSYSNPRPVSYEIKVSRSDFLSDVTSGKWQKYLAFSGGVIFAVPAGLITRNEVPAECGLIVRNDAGWKTLKRERPGTGRPEFRSMMKLLIDGVDRVVKRETVMPRESGIWHVSDRVRKALGKDVSDYLQKKHHALADAERYKQECADFRDEAKSILQSAEGAAREKASEEKERALSAIEPLRKDVVAALGIPPDSSWKKIQYARYRVVNDLDKDAAFRSLEMEIRSLRQTIQRAAKEAEKILPHEQSKKQLSGLFEEDFT